MSSDGGARAISGFLYQVLAGGALRAAGDCKDFRTSDTKELTALIELASDGQVIHEVADEDIVIRTRLVDPSSGKNTQEITLVQAKFSISGPSKSIGPGELAQIINSFQSAAKRLKNDGAKVAGYVLVTNRVITKDTPSLKGKQKQGIYKQLQKIEKANISRWHNALEVFARKFGRRDAEILDGRHKLLGRIFESTTSGASQREITRDYLLECLGGGPRARELCSRARASEMERDVNLFDVDVSSVAIVRDQLSDIDRQCEGRALVVFAGSGGMGKTAALHQWASDLAKRARSTNATPLVALDSAYALPNDWLSELVHDWNPDIRPVNQNDALERLVIANPLSVPVVHLALDGVDEHRGDARISPELHKLVSWFGQLDQEAQSGKPLQARLVVTCRDNNEFFRECLALGRSGGSLNAKKEPLTIQFGRFSEGELRRLLEANCPELIPEILPSAQAWGLAGTDSDDLPRSRSDLPEMTKLLLDPVMWRGFCTMDKNDRVRLVQGHADARTKLAATFCKRFLQKAHERTGIAVDYLQAALSLIARSNQLSTPGFRPAQGWVKPACEVGLDTVQTQRLKLEAVSGGLIHKEPDERWDWRNDLIESYLASLSLQSNT